MDFSNWSLKKSMLAILLIGVVPGACWSGMQKISIFEDDMRAWDPGAFQPEAVWTKAEVHIPLLLAGLPADAPQEFTLPNLVQPGNQGVQTSSAAWATGYLAHSYLYRSNYKELDYTCSPAFIYNQLVYGQDSGIELLDALEFLNDSGCAHIVHMPYRDRDYLHRPTPRALENAAQHPLKGFARVDYTDINQIRAHLLNRRVVVVTMMISENFLNLEEPIWEQPAGQAAGRHSLGVVGYDDANQVLILQNSVGGEWGADGRVAIPYHWFTRLTQKAYILY